MTATAKLFRHGGSLAVRLPKEFRLPGNEVRVSRIGNKVILEPMEGAFDVAAWRAKLRELGGAEFLTEGAPEEPSVPADDVSFD